MATELLLQLEGVGKILGEGRMARRVLRGIDFAIEREEVMCLVGPSGSGKSTLLRCMSGLLEPSEGVVRFDGRDLKGVPREAGFVFQNYDRSLFPWLRVMDNVALPLIERGERRKAARRRAAEALESVGLSASLRLYPWQLSGGMQQRVAIARALSYGPKLLFLDEPFASLDAQMRSELQDLVLSIRHSFSITVVMVTHDIDEAIYLGDRVLLLAGVPATIVSTFKVDLPRPREQVETREDRRFLGLRREIMTHVKGQRSSAVVAGNGVQGQVHRGELREVGGVNRLEGMRVVSNEP